MTPDTERQAKSRAARKRLGLVRRDVWAHPDDWPEIRALVKRLQEAREDES